MKLKNMLMLAFIVLTFIPILIVLLLLYKSGFELSREAYVNNTKESITVQVDYISQTIENNMVSEYRFANQKEIVLAVSNFEDEGKKKGMLDAFQYYLENAEDKIAACMLLDKDDNFLYTIGEKRITDHVIRQLPTQQERSGQTIQEFELGHEVYSMGIITPIFDEQKQYSGCFVSIYDKSYIFKIISSYYKIADTLTYICRKNGGVINFKGNAPIEKHNVVEQAIKEQEFLEEGIIHKQIDGIPVNGYYKNISNAPWYLVGFINETQVYQFTNQYIFTYVIIIIGVLIADVLLSIYFSKKVVVPINELIRVMEGYQISLNSNQLHYHKKSGYYETKYLRTKFLELMKNIALVQHNFESIYQLYQSNAMEDTNIDIDVREQTIQSNKDVFQSLMDGLQVRKEACIVERFVNCFCDNDKELLMKMFEAMRDEHLSSAQELEVYTPYMNQRWFHVLVVPMYQEDRLSRLFVQLRDISNFRKQEFVASEQARTDVLTGLCNRMGFTEYVDEILNEHTGKELHSLLFLDMNYFKMVNDNFGHKEGDAVLRSVANTLLETVEDRAVISRYGGDEFAVFLTDTTKEKTFEIKARLEKLLLYPYCNEKISFTVSASIGVSFWESEVPCTLEQLLVKADADMYMVKREFKERR